MLYITYNIRRVWLEVRTACQIMGSRLQVVFTQGGDLVGEVCTDESTMGGGGGCLRNI